MKLQKQSIRKIDISQINITENVRKQYDDIEQLARSIERDGQLQPIGVIEKDDNTFDMLYGFRRLTAFKFLIDEGKDYNQIEAKITRGDPAIIQLIENIHRDNLKPEEFEDALGDLENSGLSQTEIAERLNIRLTKVSDALAAKHTRDEAKKQGIDTTGLSTSTMSIIRSVPKEQLKEKVEKIKKNGGTVNAARKAKNEIIIEPQGMEKTNPEHCNKGEYCNNQDKCTYCSYNSKGMEAYPKTEITISEFLNMPEVNQIIKNFNLKLVCDKCGEKF